MKARKVLDDAVKVLKASTAIDHWQRGRERLEAEDLLWHVLGRLKEEQLLLVRLPQGSTRREFLSIIGQTALPLQNV